MRRWRRFSKTISWFASFRTSELSAERKFGDSCMRLFAFIAVFLVAASAVHASAATSDLEEEKLLQRARLLREQGELKAAAALIRERLKATGVFRFVRQYDELLARVQFESGDFRGAWQRARRLEQNFEQFSKNQNTAAERLGLQLLLADIELAGEFLDRVRTRLARALELAQKSSQPMDRVETLVRLARLEEFAEDRALASRRWSQIRAACEGLIARADIRNAEFETYRRASDFLADAHVAEKDFAAAVAALVRLKDAYRPIADDGQRLETIRKIADVHRQAGNHDEQRASLKESLALLESQREHNIAAQGDIWREIGDSFQRQSDEFSARQDFAAARDHSLAAEKQWRKAMRHYSAAITVREKEAPGSAGGLPATTLHLPPGKVGGLLREATVRTSQCGCFFKLPPRRNCSRTGSRRLPRTRDSWPINAEIWTISIRKLIGPSQDLAPCSFALDKSLQTSPRSSARAKTQSII